MRRQHHEVPIRFQEQNKKIKLAIDEMHAANE
jgi:hypothetical protein